MKHSSAPGPLRISKAPFIAAILGLTLNEYGALDHSGFEKLKNIRGRYGTTI